MTERVEPEPATIPAHAALAHAAKRECQRGYVHQRVIHASATRGHGFETAFLKPLGRGKHIKRQRLGPASELRQHLIKFRVDQTRQNRTEYLLVHDPIAPFHVPQHCRRQEPCGAIVLLRGLLGRRQQFQQPIIVAVVDNPRIIGTLTRLTAVELLDRFSHTRQKVLVN